MRIHLAITAPVVAFWALVACTTPDILTPATGPGTDYPCGVGGNVCAGSTRSHPICCPRGEECTDGVIDGPDIQCQFVGDDVIPGEMVRGDAGVHTRRTHPALRF